MLEFELGLTEQNSFCMSALNLYVTWSLSSCPVRFDGPGTCQRDGDV